MTNVHRACLLFALTSLSPLAEGCARSKSTAAEGAASAAAPESQAPDAASPKGSVEVGGAAKGAAAGAQAPFTAVGTTKSFTATEACFSELAERWNVMVGRNSKKPCDFETEDGFALSFTMRVGSAAKSPLPKPGQTFEDRVYVEADGASKPVHVDAKIEVLRHEKPFVVVRLTPKGDKLPPGIQSFGGTLRVRVRAEDEVFVDQASWSTSSGAEAGAKKPKLEKKGKGVELSIWDTSDVRERIESCGDGSIVVVLPLYPGADDWKVKADSALGTPTREVRKGWRGPSSDSEAFRWDALKAKPGDHVVTFTSGSDVVTIPIKVDPAHVPCD